MLSEKVVVFEKILNQYNSISLERYLELPTKFIDSGYM